MQSMVYGGESGIRTRVTVSRKHTFQACAFNHSATSPSLHVAPAGFAARVGDMPPGIFARGLRAMGAVNHGQPFPAPVEATGAGLI